LLYVEPTEELLNAFGHKTRQLLILACTEVETYWKYYLDKAGITPTGQGFRTKSRAPLYAKYPDSHLIEIEALKAGRADAFNLRASL
jgi:hypothetical protein